MAARVLAFGGDASNSSSRGLIVLALMHWCNTARLETMKNFHCCLYIILHDDSFATTLSKLQFWLF